MGLNDPYGTSNIPYSQANPPRQSQIGYYGQIATYPDESEEERRRREEERRRQEEEQAELEALYAQKDQESGASFLRSDPAPPVKSPEDSVNEFIRSKFQPPPPKKDTRLDDLAKKNARLESMEERPVDDDWREDRDEQGRTRPAKTNPRSAPGTGEFEDKFYQETDKLVTSQDWDQYIQQKENKLKIDVGWGNAAEWNVWDRLLRERATRSRDEAGLKEELGPEKAAEYDALKLGQKEKNKAGFAARKDGLLLGMHLEGRKKPDWPQRLGKLALTSLLGVTEQPPDNAMLLAGELKRKYPSLSDDEIQATVDQSLSNARAWIQIRDGSTSDTNGLLELMDKKVWTFERLPGFIETTRAERGGRRSTRVIEDPEQKKQFKKEQAEWTAKHSSLYDSLYNRIESARRLGKKLQKTVGSLEIGGQSLDLETFFVSQVETEKMRYEEVVKRQRADDNAPSIMRWLKENREATARKLGLEEGSPRWKEHTHVDRNEIYEWEGNITNTLKNSYEDSIAVRHLPIRILERSLGKFVLEATSLAFTSMEQAFDEQRYGPSMDWYSADTVKKIIGSFDRAADKAATELGGENYAWVEGVFAEVAPQLTRMAVARSLFKLVGISGTIPFAASVSWGGAQEMMNGLRDQAELGVPKDKMMPAALLMFAAEVIPEAILYGAGAGVARQFFNPAQYSNWIRGLGTSFMVAAKNAPAELMQEWITTFLQQHVRANFGIDPHATTPRQMYEALKRTFWVSLGMSLGGGITSSTGALSLVNQLRKMEHITPEMYEEFAKAFQETRENRQKFGVVDGLDMAHEFVSMFRAEAQNLVELGPDKATSRKNWEEHGPGQRDKDGKPVKVNAEQRRQMFNWIATAVADLENAAVEFQQEKDEVEEQKPVQDFEVSAINRETNEETVVKVPAKNIEDAEGSVTGYKTTDGVQLFDPVTEQEAPAEQPAPDSLLEQTREMFAEEEVEEPAALEPVEQPQEPEVDLVRQEVADRVDPKGMGAIDAAAALDPTGTLLERVEAEVPIVQPEVPAEAPVEAPTEVAPETAPVDTEESLNAKLVPELRTQAEGLGVNHRGLKKAAIIEKILEAQAPTEAAEKGLTVQKEVGEQVEETWGKGSEVVTITHPESGAAIKIVHRTGPTDLAPSGASSVIELIVPEEHRGKGIGRVLQEEAQKQFPNLQGQVSSKAAAKNAHRLGRRPVGKPNATLKEVFEIVDKDGSVNMVTPEAQGLMSGELTRDEYPDSAILFLSPSATPTEAAEGAIEAPVQEEVAAPVTLADQLISIGQEVNDAVADPKATAIPNVFDKFAKILPEINAELADEVAKAMGAESFAAIPEDTLRAVQADVQKFLETGKAPSTAMAQLFAVYRDFINRTITTPGQVPPKKIQALLDKLESEVTVKPLGEKETNDVLDKYSDSDLVRLAQRMKIDVTDKSLTQIRDEVADVVATDVYLEDATERLEVSDKTAERKQGLKDAGERVRNAIKDMANRKTPPVLMVLGAKEDLELASAVYNYLYAKVEDAGITVAQASAKMFSDLNIKVTKDNYEAVQKILDEQGRLVQQDIFRHPEAPEAIYGKKLTEEEQKIIEAPTYKGAAFLADHINRGTPATVEQFYAHMEKTVAGWTGKDDQGKPLMSASQKLKAWYDALMLSTAATTEYPASGRQEGKGLTPEQQQQRSLMMYLFRKAQQAKTPQEAKRLIDAMRKVGNSYQKTVDAVVRRLEKAKEKYELLRTQNKLTKEAQRERKKELGDIKSEWSAIIRELGVSRKDWMSVLTKEEIAGDFKNQEEMLEAASKLQTKIQEVTRKQSIKDLKKTLSRLSKRAQLPFVKGKFADLVKDMDTNLVEPGLSEEKQDEKLRKIIFGELLPYVVDNVRLKTTVDGKTARVLLSEIGDNPTPEQVDALMELIVDAPASMFKLPTEAVKDFQTTAKLLSRKNINNLTEEEANSISENVQNLIHVNRKYLGYFRKQSEAEIQRIALESAEEIFEVIAPVPVPVGPQAERGRVHHAIQKPFGWVRDAMEGFWGTTALATPETMATMIAGQKGEKSTTYKFLYRNLNDGAKAQSQTQHNNRRYLIQALKQVGVDLDDPAQAKEFLKLSSAFAEEESLLARLKDKSIEGKGKAADRFVFKLSQKSIKGKSGGRAPVDKVGGAPILSELSLTPMEIAYLQVTLRDPRWREVLAVDNKDNPKSWAPLQFRKGGEKYYISNEDIDAIRNYSGNHHEIIRAVSNAIWDQYNGPMGAAVREYMLSVDGVETTREYYAPGHRFRGDQDIKIKQLTPEVLRSGKAAVEHLNILQERTDDETSGVAIRDALADYMDHSQFTSGLQHLARPIAEAEAIRQYLAGEHGIGRSRRQGLWKSPKGAKVLRYYEELLNDLTVQTIGGRGPNLAMHDRATRQLARNITVGGLGLNPRVWMFQVTSLSTASSEIQWKYIAGALKGGRKLSWAEAARSKLTGEEKRHTTQDEINFWSTLRDRLLGQRFGLVSEGLSDVTQHPLIQKKMLTDRFMAGIGGMDAVAIRTIWEAAKLELNDQINDPGYKGNLKLPADWQSEPAYWKAVAARAEQIVDRTQPSMDLMNLSGLARSARRGNVPARMVTMFMAQRMKNVNLGLRAVHDIRQGKIKDGVSKAASVLVYQTVGIAAIKELYDLGSGSIWGMVAQGITGLPEEPKDKMKPSAEYLDYIIDSWFSNLPLGQLPGFAARQALKAATGHEGKIYPPGISPVLSFADDVKNAKFSTSKAARSALLSVATGFGVPVHFAREFNKAYNRREVYSKIISRRGRGLLSTVKNEHKGDYNRLPKEQLKEWRALNHFVTYENKDGDATTTTRLKRIGQLGREANAIDKEAENLPASLTIRKKNRRAAAQKLRVEADKMAQDAFEEIFNK